MNSFSIPGLDLSNLYHLLILFFFASLRISALLISMPFFSITFIPLQARIVLSMSITIFIFPYLSIPNITEMSILKVFFIILSEIGLGLSVGLLLSILFSVASVSAEKMASTAGLSMANMIEQEL